MNYLIIKMAEYRNAKDIWNAVDYKRPKQIKRFFWKRTYEGIHAALLYIGLTLVNTKEEFEKIPVPTVTDKNGTITKKYTQRKVVVEKNGVRSEPTNIHSLLSGTTQLLTDEERVTNNEKLSEKMSILRIKGLTISNDSEKNTIDNLDEILEISKHLNRHHLLENRLADIAYALPDSDLCFADQAKSSTSGKDGRCTFGLKYRKNVILFDKWYKLDLHR